MRSRCAVRVRWWLKWGINETQMMRPEHYLPSLVTFGALFDQMAITIEQIAVGIGVALSETLAQLIEAFEAFEEVLHEP